MAEEPVPPLFPQAVSSTATVVESRIPLENIDDPSFCFSRLK
jgi:hypothetical protein